MALNAAPTTSVTFYELAGSPQEKYTAAGFQARRRFLVAWEDRANFAKDIMGSASRFDYRSAAYYPERNSVFPSEITIEPADKNAVVQKSLKHLHLDLNSYKGSWALVTVDYETISSETDIDDSPEAESGTSITYRLSYETTEMELSGDGWVWADATSTPLPTGTVLLRQTPCSQHQLVWKKVVSPPWSLILQTQGKINQAAFLGCEPGTLLFVGAASNKLYRSTYEEGESPFCWAITYTFLQKAIHVGNDVYGWNHVFRNSDGIWAIPQNNGAKLYEEADFSLLFQSE